MTSERQLAANRQNAQHATGPRTPAGRAVSSLNAARHVTLIVAATTLVDDRFSPDTFSAPDVIPDGVHAEDLPDWTVERLQRLIDIIASSLDRQPDEFVAAISARVREHVNADRSLVRPFDLQVRDLRRQRILPPAANLTPTYREMPPRPLHYYPGKTNPDLESGPSSEPDPGRLA